MLHNWNMSDPDLYLSMALGFGGVYVLISSFHDDDDGDDDGEKYIILASFFLSKLKQETPPEIPTTERVIKSIRNYIESIYVLQQT